MHAYFCVDTGFQILWVNTKEMIAGLYGMSMYVYFCKKLPNCLPKWLYHFVFLQAIKENSAFGVVNVPNFGHSNRYVGISLHSLNFLMTFAHF